MVGADAPSRAAVEEALDEGNAWAKRAPVLIAAGARRVDAAVVEAETVQVMYDYTTGRPVPMDADFLARARDYIGG